MKDYYLFFGLLLALALFSCKDGNSGESEMDSVSEVEHKGGQSSVVDDTSEPNALQMARSLADFSTLVAAIEAAGIEDAVVNVGPLTVFAPVNEAFEKLPAGTLENLLMPENKGQLAYILTNHVAPANYPDNQLEREAQIGRKLYMASGKYLDVIIEDEEIFVGSTKILQTVRVSNGWIHVIGDVLVPQD